MKLKLKKKRDRESEIDLVAKCVDSSKIDVMSHKFTRQQQAEDISLKHIGSFREAVRSLFFT